MDLDCLAVISSVLHCNYIYSRSTISGCTADENNKLTIVQTTLGKKKIR